MLQAHGGQLINRKTSSLENGLQKAATLYQLKLEDRYVCDCEMIAIGGFSPLTGFMDKKNAERVVREMRLENGLIWSIPVVLPITLEQKVEIESLKEIVLIDKENRPIAIMQVGEIFELDLQQYCQNVYGTQDPNHPGVQVVQNGGNLFLSGPLELLNKPMRWEIEEKYFLEPKETRELFTQKGWQTVCAFQTRNPIHRAHEYLIKCALEQMDGFLIHPLVGSTKSDDIPAPVRMQCYETLLANYFNHKHTSLSVLPAAMRYAGPREAILHLIIRKNYGCTHMIIGRDHAGVGDYYGTYQAQELVSTVENELEIKALKFEHSFHCFQCDGIVSAKTCPHSTQEHLILSGTKVRAMLKEGTRPPAEFSRPEVADILINWAKSA